MQTTIHQPGHLNSGAGTTVVFLTIILLTLTLCFPASACTIDGLKLYVGKTSEEAENHVYDANTMYICVGHWAYFRAEIDGITGPEPSYEGQWWFDFDGNGTWDYNEPATFPYDYYCDGVAWDYDDPCAYTPKVKVELDGEDVSAEATCSVLAFRVQIVDEPPEKDTDEYFCYQSPNDANIYYKIEPTTGWTLDSPSSVQLRIYDGSVCIRTDYPGTGLGDQHATWNGQNGNSVWVDCGEYTAIMAVEKQGSTCYSNEHTITVLPKVDKLQYYDNYTSSYIDMPDPLYVVKGESVLLKAIKDPPGASWPSGKPVWGGTAGLSGTGETKVLSVATVSSSSTDYKTVTVTCCNTITGNVIVYDFEGVLTPQDNFSGRSQTNYGIEENVNLTCTMDPSDLTATQVGGLKWYKYSGVGSVTGGTDGAGTYDAEESAGSVNLFLRVESGPCRAYNKDYYKTVVAPSGTRMTRVNPGTVWHIQGSPTAGIKLYYWLDPRNVSFSNLYFGEDACPTTGVSGYFTECHPDYPGGGPLPGHSQGPSAAILGGNSTTGCRVSLADHASAGADTVLWAAGSYTWSIPTQYIDDTSTRSTFGSNQNHVGTIEASGYTTISKGGQSGSAALNDPTSGW
jgi:hypothetical protein